MNAELCVVGELVVDGATEDDSEEPFDGALAMLGIVTVEDTVADETPELPATVDELFVCETDAEPEAVPEFEVLLTDDEEVNAVGCEEVLLVD